MAFATILTDESFFLVDFTSIVESWYSVGKRSISWKWSCNSDMLTFLVWYPMQDRIRLSDENAWLFLIRKSPSAFAYIPIFWPSMRIVEKGTTSFVSALIILPLIYLSC